MNLLPALLPPLVPLPALPLAPGGLALLRLGGALLEAVLVDVLEEDLDAVVGELLEAHRHLVFRETGLLRLVVLVGRGRGRRPRTDVPRREVGKAALWVRRRRRRRRLDVFQMLLVFHLKVVFRLRGILGQD